MSRTENLLLQNLFVVHFGIFFLFHIFSVYFVFLYLKFAHFLPSLLLSFFILVLVCLYFFLFDSWPLCIFLPICLSSACMFVFLLMFYGQCVLLLLYNVSFSLSLTILMKCYWSAPLMASVRYWFFLTFAGLWWWTVAVTLIVLGKNSKMIMGGG